MMTKYSAFGTALDIGVQQVETATLILDGADIVTSGNANVVTTCTGMTGTPITTVVAILEDDTLEEVAEKMRVELLLETNLVALFHVEGSGAQIVLRLKIPQANIADLNIAIADDTSDGITAAPTSVNTTAGVLAVEIAQVKSLGGPGISIDTEDVTTHDSPNAWEELLATILRSGELSLDLVFDPNAATHDASTGLVYYTENKTLVYTDLDFMGLANWTFTGVVTKFEPTEPVDGALTASATLKITGEPTLA